MSKTADIINLFSSKLFSGNLRTEDFLTRGLVNIAFACPHASDCDADEKQPIWTAAIGSKTTDVMIVGEAPSATEGVGVHMGGRFDTWKNNRTSPIVPFRDWVVGHFGTIPYFTDLVKCGVAKQRNKSVLKNRIPICMEYLLKREIQIIRPIKIICVGGISYEFLKKIVDEIGWKIELFKLTHYSRQAQLPLSIEDKKKIMWEWEIAEPDSHEREEIQKMPLSYLSHFSSNSR